MKQEKNRNVIIALLLVIIVILLVLVVLLATGTVSFKSESIDNTDQSSENTNNDIINNTNDNSQQVDGNQNESTSSTVDSNNVNRVFISENNTGYYLILWDDGTYKYTNSDGTSGTLGRYSLDNEELILYYMFSIDNTNKNRVNVTDDSKTLKVTSQSQITDGDIILNSANQSARVGGENFYTNLYSLLKYYDDEQKKELGIN